MESLSEPLCERRHALGLTQADLSARAGVSLATLQNIEADHANPTLSTLMSVLDVLGLDLVLCSRSVDWDALCVLGLPMIQERECAVERSPEMLEHHLHLAVAELRCLKDIPGADRKRDAVRGLLLALRDHFPQFHGGGLARSSMVSELLDGHLTGREIKLTRIARRTLAEYL